jgi:hypothetical protein
VSNYAKPLHAALLEDKLPLNYNLTTVTTIEQIDVLWITKRGAMQGCAVLPYLRLPGAVIGECGCCVSSLKDQVWA